MKYSFINYFFTSSLLYNNNNENNLIYLIIQILTFLLYLLNHTVSQERHVWKYSLLHVNAYSIVTLKNIYIYNLRAII